MINQYNNLQISEERKESFVADIKGKIGKKQLEIVHSSQIKVSADALISHGPSSNSYWVEWAHYASKIPLTEIDLKVVAAGPTASFLTRFLGHTDCE